MERVGYYCVVICMSFTMSCELDDAKPSDREYATSLPLKINMKALDNKKLSPGHYSGVQIMVITNHSEFEVGDFEGVHFELLANGNLLEMGTTHLGVLELKPNNMSWQYVSDTGAIKKIEFLGVEKDLYIFRISNIINSESGHPSNSKLLATTRFNPK